MENIQKQLESLPSEPSLDNIKELTKEQKEIIFKRWKDNSQSPPALKELVELCFGPNVDGRNKISKLIKEYCATFAYRPASSFTYVKKEIPLTAEQKEYIANNCGQLKSYEMARVLFNNKSLGSLNAETKAVDAYKKSLPNVILYDDTSDEIKDNEEYFPPRNLPQAAARVNKYVLHGINQEDIEKNQKTIKNLNCLIKYCHIQRFKMMINRFVDKNSKELFEGSYVRYLWDKGDEVTEEELDLYINLCCDIVNYTKSQSELEHLIDMRDKCAEDSDGKRLSLSIVQAISDIRKEMDDNHKRQQRTIETLQGKRNERVTTKSKENASIIQLIDFWRNHENRQQIMRLAEARKNKIKDEIDRLATLDELKCEIFGITPEEVLG